MTILGNFRKRRLDWTAMNIYCNLANPWEADTEGVAEEKIHAWEDVIKGSLPLGLPLGREPVCVPELLLLGLSRCPVLRA